MSISQAQGVFNAPNENGVQSVGATSHYSARFAHYSVTSRTTSQGIRAHTIQTNSAHVANLFFGAALDFDDEPTMAENGGTYTVYFYADDNECDAVIMAATGGKA